MGCFQSKSTNKIYIKDYLNNLYDCNFWRSNDECCICLDRTANTLFLPCRHLVVCDVCASQIYSDSKCPLCQQDIYSFNLLQIISVVPTN